MLNALDISLNTDKTVLITPVDGTDESLVRSVLDGDDAAFAMLFDRHKAYVARVVARLFREREMIEDIVQRTFIKCYFSLRTYRGARERSFRAWLSRIAVNFCYDEFRRRKRQGESLFAEISDDERELISSIADGAAVSPENTAITGQIAQRMLASVEPRDRIALMLVYSEEHSLADVAGIMGISVANLKSRLFRSREQIRRKFGRCLG